MNILFGLLNKGIEIPDSYSWYAKRTESVPLSDKTINILDIITIGVPDSKLALYAAVLCNLVMKTQYGPEIAKLDPNNTYVPVTRPPDTAHSSKNYCMHDLIQPIAKYRPVKVYLDRDILDTLDDNSWFDLMGAACLQLLREVN